MKDAPYVEVTFTKSELGGDEIAGAKIQIFKANEDGTFGEMVDEWISSDTEPHKIKLPDGDYIMHEEAAPNGFYVATDIPFTVKYGDATATAKVNMDDERWAEVVISKTDAATTEELEGATLIVEKINDDGSVTFIEQWVSTNEPHKIRLEEGTYTLTEITAPDGYNVAETITFTVNRQGLVEGEKVEMKDQPYTDVRFSKQDLGGVEIGGATIQIIDESGKVIDQWISKAGQSHMISLPDGNYVMHEEVAPDGYFVATDIPFVVKAGEAYNTTYVEMHDKPLPVIEISKTDMVTGHELPDAVLLVERYNDDGSLTEIASWTSTNEPHKIQLEPGNYKLTETIAPFGYSRAVESVDFTVDEDGLVGQDKLEMKNASSKVKDFFNINVTLEKKWLDLNGNETEWPEGAEVEFTLQYYDRFEQAFVDYAPYGTPVKVVLTKDQPTVVFEELEAEIDGVTAQYRAVETKIDGYEIATSTFTNLDAKIGNMVAINVPEKPDGPEEFTVYVSKCELGGTEIAGAHMIIYGADGNVVAEWDSTTEAHAVTLKPGSYTMVETVAPDGYRQVTTAITFVVDHYGNVTLGTTVVDNDGRISVQNGNHVILEDAPMPEKQKSQEPKTPIIEEDKKETPVPNEEKEIPPTPENKVTKTVPVTPSTTRRVVTTPSAKSGTAVTRATSTGDSNNNALWIAMAAAAAAAMAGLAFAIRRRRRED
jgi:uncharacterized surface anchored protein